jgi:hypothetical protein
MELKVIQPGAKLIQYVVLPSGTLEFPPLRHAAAFAVADRGAFIPSLFAQPFNGESVSYLDPKSEIFNVGKGGTIKSMGQVRWLDICGRYEYVLITGPQGGLTFPKCLQMIANDPYFALFSVVKK